jgi:hypothetical protein
MKRLKFLAGVLAVAAVLGAMSVPMAAAQALDNVWFKVMVQTKGHSVDLATGAYATLNLSITSYILFHWDSANNRYNLDLWNNTADGWAKSPVLVYIYTAPQENIFSPTQLALKTPEGLGIATFHIPLITHKTDAHGGLHATWKGTGWGNGGNIAHTNGYYCSFNITGTNIDIAKLPFTP